MADGKGYLLPTTVTDKFSLRGLVNLINPLSQVPFFRGSGQEGKDWVAPGLIRAFSSGEGRQSSYERNAGPAKAAHILSKVIAGGAALGGAAWLLRAFMHSLDIDNVEDIKSSARASRKLETVKSRPVDPAVAYKGKKDEKQGLEKAENLKKRATNAYDMALGALPPMAALAAMLASFKLADKTYDTALGNKLDKELSAAKSESQDLALKRILRNRGLEQAEPEEEAVADVYNQQLKEKAKKRPRKQLKVASLDKKEEAKWLPQGLNSSIGLLLMAMFATGGVVGFNWQRNNSPALAKYKAYKKGLETYNKERVLSENIESTPLDPEFLDYLDTNVASAKKSAPAQPTETSLQELLV